MSKPLVSVIIPSYNHGEFISEAINSVLNQDYPKERIEIIIVDDGSTDDTRKIIKKFRGKVKYIHQKNSGQASAVKKGLNLCSGKYFFLLNADDVFLKNKVKKVIRLFEKDREIVHISHPVSYWYQKDNTKKEERIPDKIKGRKIKGKKVLHYFYTNNLFFGGGSTIAGRMDILKKTKIKKEVNMCIDEYLAVSLLNSGSSYFFDEPLSLYRIHEENYSKIAVNKKPKNIKANQAIFSSIKKGDFGEKIKRLYCLKALVSKIKFKEAVNKKTLADIFGLWSYILKNIAVFNINMPRIIKNYRILQRSIPMWAVRLLKKNEKT